VTEARIFSDAAVSGASKSLHKRTGYAALVSSWERGQFDVLVCDELSRLGRDSLELAHVQSRVETTGIRLITADGLIDSSRDGWQLHFGFSSIMSAHFLRETSYRVTRGMRGQLERGFMIAAAPFGYTSIRSDADDGTRWVIDLDAAKWVKEIYAQRRKGLSFSAIARFMNKNGIPSPRPSRLGGVRYWRPATVRQLVSNQIYKGLFLYNGSAFTKAKARRQNKSVETTPFERPELRIVDDATWNECNTLSSKRPLRSGAKHLLAGLCTCGTCGATLTVATGGSVPALYCAQCDQAKRAGVPHRRSLYVTARGVQEVLLAAMRDSFSDAEIQAFREMMAERLHKGNRSRKDELKRDIERVERSRERLARLLREVDADDPAIKREFIRATEEKAHLVAELVGIDACSDLLDEETVARLLSVNPLDVLPRLFEPGQPVDKVRGALRQVFPRIIFTDKPTKFASILLVEIDVGAGFEEASKTEGAPVVIKILRYRVEAGARRPSRWVVTRLPDA
jgi:site-specific DNA recombinase